MGWDTSLSGPAASAGGSPAASAGGAPAARCEATGRLRDVQGRPIGIHECLSGVPTYPPVEASYALVSDV